MNPSLPTRPESEDPRETERRIVYVVRGPDEIGDHDEIDLASVLRRVWTRRWLVAGVTALTAIASIAYALLATPVFRAEVVVLPREDGGALGLPGGLGSLGGLAGLAGIDLGGRGDQEPLGLLRSYGFVRRFVEQNGLTELLSAEAKGDPLDPASARVADARKATDYFTRSVLTVEEDPKSDLIKVQIEWQDAEQAALWANELVDQLNEEMRQRALKDAQTSLRYLTAQLDQTSNVMLRDSLGKLIESEMRTLMLATGTEEFAFRIIDPAQVPRLRQWPKRTLIAIAGTGLGFLLGLLVAVLVDPVGRLLRTARSIPAQPRT